MERPRWLSLNPFKKKYVRKTIVERPDDFLDRNPELLEKVVAVRGTGVTNPYVEGHCRVLKKYLSHRHGGTQLMPEVYLVELALQLVIATLGARGRSRPMEWRLVRVGGFEYFCDPIEDHLLIAAVLLEELRPLDQGKRQMVMVRQCCIFQGKDMVARVLGIELSEDATG